GRGGYRTAEGYGTNKVAAEQVLLDSGLPVTVLRPSKIHGPGTRQPREWVFVRRVLDGRPVVVLAHQGAGVDHPTASATSPRSSRPWPAPRPCLGGGAARRGRPGRAGPASLGQVATGRAGHDRGRAARLPASRRLRRHRA